MNTAAPEEVSSSRFAPAKVAPSHRAVRKLTFQGPVMMAVLSKEIANKTTEKCNGLEREVKELMPS